MERQDARDYTRVLGHAPSGLSQLDGCDVIRFMAFHDQVFISIQAAYLQWQSNTLDERLWGTFRQAFVDLLSQPGQKDWWRQRRHWFDDEFQAYVDRTLESAEGKPMHPKAL